MDPTFKHDKINVKTVGTTKSVGKEPAANPTHVTM
jgi:hypothetical protein